jgi:predicted CopG family antitoxin
MKTTTIQIFEDVKEKLKKMGKKGDTYNDIIKRLIEKIEYIKFMEEQYKILDSEKQWKPLC